MTSTSIVMYCLKITDLQFNLLPNDMRNYILLLRIDVVFCTRTAVLVITGDFIMVQFSAHGGHLHKEYH
jgi:hypothetical protein